MKQVIKNYTITSLVFSLIAVWFNVIFGLVGFVETGSYYLNGWTLFYTIIAAPFLEEVVFRLGLFNLLYKFTKNYKICIIVTAILFGLIHIIPGVDKLHIVQAIYATVCGFILGYVFYLSGRKINYTLIMHIIANILTLFIPSIIFTNYNINVISFIILGIVIICLLFYIKKGKKVLDFGKTVEESGNQTGTYTSDRGSDSSCNKDIKEV